MSADHAAQTRSARLRTALAVLTAGSLIVTGLTVVTPSAASAQAPPAASRVHPHPAAAAPVAVAARPLLAGGGAGGPSTYEATGARLAVVVFAKLLRIAADLAAKATTRAGRWLAARALAAAAKQAHRLLAEAGAPKVPTGHTVTLARNGRGAVFRPTPSDRDADSIRVMTGDSRYPGGHVRYYNKHRQALDPRTGRPGGKAETHVSLDSYRGPWLGWPT